MYLITMQDKKNNKYIGNIIVEARDIQSALKRGKNEKIRQLMNSCGLSKKEAKITASKIRFSASYIEGISDYLKKYLF